MPWSKVAILGMAIPPLIGILNNGYINPYYWVDEFIPYYMEIMGVDRPDCTIHLSKRIGLMSWHHLSRAQGVILESFPRCRLRRKDSRNGEVVCNPYKWPANSMGFLEGVFLHPKKPGVYEWAPT